MYLVFTRMLGESYRGRLKFLLYLCISSADELPCVLVMYYEVANDLMGVNSNVQGCEVQHIADIEVF